MTTQQIQQFLNSQGYKGADGKPLTVDGVSGTNTKFAIEAYQKANGLTTDGVAGIETQAKMQSSPVTSTTGNSGSSTSSSTTSTPSSENYSTTGDTPTSYYGNKTRDTSAETQSLTEEQSVADVAQGAGILSSSTVSSITSDPSIVAFYVNALTYGGYTIGDVLNDMKRRELINSNPSNSDTLKNLTIIDPNQTKVNYTATAAGQKSVTDTATNIPTFNFQGLMNPDILKYGANIPDDLFKTLVPLLDPSSQEYKDAVATVKSTYFDLATSALQATTEQDKAVADYNLDQFKQQLNTKYGITLSSDATKAWTQIENIQDTMSQNGLEGSGMQNEAVDDSLKATRLADQQSRDEKLTEDQQNDASYYRTSASAAQIAALTPQQRQDYGLTPSSDVAQQYSIANIQAKNPTWTTAMVQAAHDSIIDENGNYRSSLYSNYYSQLSTNEQTNEQTAETAVTTDAENKEGAAYKDYTTGDSNPANNAPLNQIAKQTSTTTPSSSTTVPASTQEDTNTADKYNIYTGALNTNYKDPSAGQQDTNPNDQYNIYTGAVNNNYKAPATPAIATPTTPVTSTPTSTKSGYTGSSIVDYLSSTGKDTSYSSRAALAAAQGITNYNGSADQNTQLLTKLRGY